MPRSLTLRALGLCLLGCCLPLFTACGDDEGGSGTSADAFVKAFARASCRRLPECCNGQGQNVEAGSCQSNLELFLGLEVRGADPKNYTFSQAEADACLAGMNAETDACKAASGDPEHCGKVYQGKLANGEACSSSVECEGGSCEPNDQGQGICGGGAPAQEGEPCYWTCTEEGGGTVCSGSGATLASGEEPECYTNDGLYCTSDGVCTAQGGEGDSCSGWDSCASGLWCSSGSCAPLEGLGGSCSASDGCEAGLYCKDGSCVEELAIGASCESFFDECASGTCDNGICVEDDFGSGLGSGMMCALAGA